MKRSRSSEELNNGDEEQTMDLFLTIMKTVCVSVKKSDTVQNVKGVLNEKEAISECDQEVFFGGESLVGNCRKLVECGIQQNSTLQVFVRNSDPTIVFVPRPCNLNVKTSSHSPRLVVEARYCDTIQQVKSFIMSKQGFHSRTFDLIHAGKLLTDDRTLVSLNILESYTLYMIFTSTMNNRLAISVKTPFGAIAKIDVRSFYTLRDVRTVVESVVNCSAGRLGFVYGGVRLDNSKTLSFYNITEESTLEMVPRSMQIFVMDWNKKSGAYTIDVYPGDLVFYVKDQLVRKLGVPMEFLVLFFNGQKLQDNQSLDDYNIVEDTTIQLFPGIMMNPGSGSKYNGS